jgi:hypothetical protein
VSYAASRDVKTTLRTSTSSDACICVATQRKTALVVDRLSTARRR